jgi:hypothetical protein
MMFACIESFSPARNNLSPTLKNEIAEEKHVYTSVGVPLWSQNFQNCPLNHRVGMYMPKGVSEDPLLSLKSEQE